MNDPLLLVEVNGADRSIATPSGWTLLADQATMNPAQLRFTIWWKLAAGETSVSLPSRQSDEVARPGRAS